MIISQFNYDFVRSGDIDVEDAQFGSVGSWGFLWSSITLKYESAYYSTAGFIHIGGSSVIPSSDRYRFIGVPVRCLVY